MSDTLKDFFKKDLFAVENGVVLLEVKPGHAVAEMKITQSHMNAANTVQGGAIFTLADLAFAAAVNAHGYITLGTNAQISFFKSPKGEKLTARATEISRNRTLCCCSVDVFDGHGNLVARFIGNGYIKKDHLPL